MGRVNAELVRPFLGHAPAAPWNGYDRDKLLMAYLARAVQTRIYIHECGGRYCLKDRCTCRFFYPWPEQPQTQYDENTDRVALQRRHPADDRWVVPHNLEMAMFSPASINVLPFHPESGGHHARQYVCKYAAKPEKYFYLDSKIDDVKQFLKCRTIGICMAINRIMGFRVVRSTHSVTKTSPSFVPPSWNRMPRDRSHQQRNPDYPDPEYYLSNTMKYFFRAPELRHLRVQQFTRYFHPPGDDGEGATVEDTVEDDGVGSAWIDDEVCHKHYDEFAHNIRATAKARFHNTACISVNKNYVTRRSDSQLSISREPLFEPTGDKREAFYQLQLVKGLPWYCVRYPTQWPPSSIWQLRADPPHPHHLAS